ncbi:WD40-repeat-containing domain protein [Suillus subalutaceus]|uniref:WD40-repeat-containing domain protein n=1 Tax=Suillus subalutaceus TaxID=48586 RepID=UPI001B88350F|nr:WD40-repeat-containing domain protein [Suillus subalutaceus]KAG1841910.1 WD40-repeat-containing domain protein [Suillus subalutaceus]
MTPESSATPILEEASTPAQSTRPILKYKFEGHKERIWCFVFLHDNIHIKGEGGWIHVLALSPDGKVIACGREDGSVQRWTTDGKRIQGVWTGHSECVRSLSWSPSGSHIASGSEDGTILIRRVDSGGVEVGPINTTQIGAWSLAYSPSGERIVSGGWNRTICIWNTKTGELVVGPIQDLGKHYVTSVVWSSDSTKIYSASDRFARVLDSTSGNLLHSFEHNDTLYSVALSSKDNVPACVGLEGIAQLWDTESHQPLGQPFHQEYNERLLCVSFSRDERYVAYSGDDNKLTLWMLKDIAPQLPASTPPQQSDGQNTQEETWSNSSLSSCLDADATGGGGFIEETHDDPYNNFFQVKTLISSKGTNIDNKYLKSSQQSLPSPSPGSHLPHLFSIRRFWNVISRRRPPPDESVPKHRPKLGFLSSRDSIKNVPGARSH